MTLPRWWLPALLSALLLLPAAPAGAVTVTELQQGLAGSPSPGAPVVGPDGNVWFTDHGAIGRLTPGGAITEFSQGVPAGETPADSIVVGSDGALWFPLTGVASHAIGRLDPATGMITHYATAADASSVVEGPDGNVWFLGGAAQPAIGYVTPTGAVTEITSGFNVGASIEALAPGPDGNMWFLDDGASDAVGHVNLHVNPHTVAETTSGVSNNNLGQITAGPDGHTMWFTGSTVLGKITLPAGTVTEITAPNNGLQPGAETDEIMVGPDNNLWFDDQDNGHDAIGRINPATFAVTEFPLKTATAPWTMSFGFDGNIYAVQTGLVAQMTQAGAVTEFPTSSAMSGMDNDSIIPAPDGNLYYNDLGTPIAMVEVNLQHAPTAATGAASAITTSSATVAGSVTPLTADTTVSFRYGTTPTALNQAAAAGTLHASTTASPVAAQLAGLPAGTTVYYEAVATNANGTTTGSVQAFTTVSSPPAPAPGPSTTAASVDDQRLTLVTPSPLVCIAASARLPVTFTSSRAGRSHTHLRLRLVTFTIDRGVKHTRHARHRTVVTYTPNATAQSSPAREQLSLKGLAHGTHTLKVLATYTVGRRTVTKTLSAKFLVC